MKNWPSFSGVGFFRVPNLTFEWPTVPPAAVPPAEPLEGEIGNPKKPTPAKEGQFFKKNFDFIKVGVIFILLYF